MPELFDNKYRYVKLLGSGGFGKVFLAKEERSENLVAIKQLKNTDKTKQHAIIYEMQMVSRFNHPHIVLYKHHFVQQDLLYIVMEYCPLGSLRDLMGKEKITSTFVWKWMRELTETLQLVHEKEIIHHDIKPDNILFTENRTIKITDFGVANTGAGTRPYMSPEALKWDKGSVKDARVDIYALGVTLLELLTKQNPFIGKSTEEIIELHDLKEFGITGLPNWQQEIILKAIAKIPEQRFQSMKDFNEAIQAQAVPLLFDKEVIQAGDLAEKADALLQKKKWLSAYAILDYAEKTLKPNVNILLKKAKYHLLAQQIDVSKTYYEKALKWNPRLDVQKELGWINLELKNYPTALSLLSDHLHRNPSDYEAYNLLLQCYYETNRYEPAMDLARILLDVEPTNKCFANNYYVCSAMHHIGKTVFPNTVLKADKSENHFLNYNYGVILESKLSHNYKKDPTLKSKLLFMDYRFNKYSPSTLHCTAGNTEAFKEAETQKAIIKFGRASFDVNDVRIADGTAISRRHCVIINFKDDIWLYDLNSTGTYVNGTKVLNKVPLIGRNTIRLAKTEYEFTNDKGKLF
jgi:tetratricopeptide (TPR) repeat protein/tRNA A-37 threonylcarbamoyl transferase component Bud32